MFVKMYVRSRGLIFLQYVIKSEICCLASAICSLSFSLKYSQLLLRFSVENFKLSMIGKIIFNYIKSIKSVLAFPHIYNLYHSQVLKHSSLIHILFQKKCTCKCNK